LKIYTLIADQHGKDIDATKLLNEKCSVRACIKFESIFIGSKISLQVKVLELEVQQQGNQRPRLMLQVAPEVLPNDSAIEVGGHDVLEKSSDEEDDDNDEDDVDNKEDFGNEHDGVSSPEYTAVDPTATMIATTATTVAAAKRGGGAANRRGRLPRS
jgi:hypothetical protein